MGTRTTAAAAANAAITSLERKTEQHDGDDDGNDGNDGNQDDHNDEFDIIFHTTKLGLDIIEGGRKGGEVVVTKVSNDEYKNIIHPQDTIISIGNIRLSTSNYVTNNTTTTLLTKVLSIISSSKRPLTIRF